jgi:hypothetical protein
LGIHDSSRGERLINKLFWYVAYQPDPGTNIRTLLSGFHALNVLPNKYHKLKPQII